MLDSEIAVLEDTSSSQDNVVSAAQRSRCGGEIAEETVRDGPQVDTVLSACTSLLLPAVLAELPNLGEFMGRR